MIALLFSIKAVTVPFCTGVKLKLTSVLYFVLLSDSVLKIEHKLVDVSFGVKDT